MTLAKPKGSTRRGIQQEIIGPKSLRTHRKSAAQLLTRINLSVRRRIPGPPVPVLSGIQQEVRPPPSPAGGLSYRSDFSPRNLEKWHWPVETFGLEFTLIEKRYLFPEGNVSDDLRHKNARGLGMGAQSSGEINGCPV